MATKRTQAETTTDEHGFGGGDAGLESEDAPTTRPSSVATTAEGGQAGACPTENKKGRSEERPCELIGLSSATAYLRRRKITKLARPRPANANVEGSGTTETGRTANPVLNHVDVPPPLAVVLGATVNTAECPRTEELA